MLIDVCVMIPADSNDDDGDDDDDDDDDDNIVDDGVEVGVVVNVVGRSPSMRRKACCTWCSRYSEALSFISPFPVRR